jgi:fumarate reductase iron-sulfur subunit
MATMTSAAETDRKSGENSLEVRVWRGDTEGGGWHGYTVPARANQTVLDVVTWIQRNREPSLSYRFACRVGVCGSCAMTVNGEPRWTCRTHVNSVQKNGEITIAPLANLPVVRDLACDMTPFFDRWREAGGEFVAGSGRHDPVAPVSPQSPSRRRADDAIECINCGVCYAACDVVSWKPDYLGPAALNRAWSLVNDERDRGNVERLRKVSSDAGCHNCHSQHNCTRYCPNLQDPGAAIAGLKRATMKAALKGRI